MKLAYGLGLATTAFLSVGLASGCTSTQQATKSMSRGEIAATAAHEEAAPTDSESDANQSDGTPAQLALLEENKDVEGPLEVALSSPLGESQDHRTRMRHGGGVYKIGKPYRINGKLYVPRHEPEYSATGRASWYGPGFDGRLTANGEVFDQDKLTAAHTTLPLPSYARVTNLENGHSVVVRINDRGPYAHDRLADLSSKAASMLGFRQAGRADIQLEYLGRAPLEGQDGEHLLASYSDNPAAPAEIPQTQLAMVETIKDGVEAVGETAAKLARDTAGMVLPSTRPEDGEKLPRPSAPGRSLDDPDGLEAFDDQRFDDVPMSYATLPNENSRTVAFPQSRR